MKKGRRRSAREQRKFDDFVAHVERARKALLEAADQLQDAAEVFSRRRVPCEISAAVGSKAWRSFLALDTGVLGQLERAQALETFLAPDRRVDACGQAPCPCGTCLTTDGRPCSVCRRP